MTFEKWQALGNDYLILERDSLPFTLTPERVRRLCDGHFGVGADGVLLLSPSEDPARVAELRIFNPDGSEAELSGNGAREAILYLRAHGWTDRDEFAIGTLAGDIRPTITGPHTCRVDMGTARLTSQDFPDGAPDGRGAIDAGGRTWRFQHVSIGNPQCAIALAGGGRAAGAGPARARPADRSQRAVSQPHERVLVCRARRRARAAHPRADLRARGGGDALLGHWRERRCGSVRA